MSERTSKGKKNRKWGRDKQKCAAYASSKTREHHAAKRVLQSNGLKACVAYCRQHLIDLPKRASILLDKNKK